MNGQPSREAVVDDDELRQRNSSFSSNSCWNRLSTTATRPYKYNAVHIILECPERIRSVFCFWWKLVVS